MFNILRFLNRAARSGRHDNKPRQRTTSLAPYHRRLLCETLEVRALLSAGGAAQQSLTDLPLAAQQAISSAIGQDQSAYHAAANAAGATLANPANAFTAQLQSGVLKVSAGSDTWDMSLVGLGDGGVVQPVGTAQTTVNGNRVDNNYNVGQVAKLPGARQIGNLPYAIDEWYVNGPSGLEQGFTIPALPQSDTSGLLTVELALGGDLAGNVNAAADGLTLTGPNGSAVLGYTGLTACDSTGKSLPASLQLQTAGGRQELLIHVNAVGAQGPITIDPLFTQAAVLTASGAGGSFAKSVAISGNTVVVGGSEGGGPGAAYVFTKPASGWANMTETAILTASDSTSGDWFGFAVAISGNTVVVGAVYATVDGNSQQGAAYVFVEPATGWTDMTQTAKLTASDGKAGDQFADHVSISGNTVAVDTNDSDGTYVYTEPKTGWADMTQTAKLTATDETRLRGVSIDGNTVVAGAPIDTVGTNSYQGAAYVFVEPTTGWADMTQTARLTASDGAAGDYFGWAVSIDGNTVAVGAPDTDNDRGSAYVFTQPASGWTDMSQTAKLTASDGVAGDYFGFSVAVCGSTVVVGAYHANTDQGTAYVFVGPATGWKDMTQTAELADPNGSPFDYFGITVSIDGGTFVVGAMGANSYQGAAYVFNGAATGVTGVSPATGLLAGGTSVTISGWGFTAAMEVDFGGVKATSYTVDNDSQITATSPAGTAVGTVDVTVQTAAGTSFTSSADEFTYFLPTVTAVSSSTASGIYGQGTAIPIAVTFNAPVVVTGLPQLALNAGSGATAGYSSGSGTSTLTFTYTVAPGQSTANLDYSSTTALTLNGGTIDDTAGDAATLTLPATGTDALAAQNIVIALLSDGFETGDFSALPWQLSHQGTSSASWTVESSTVHSGSFAAQSGAIAGSATKSAGSTLSLTETLPAAGELAFWRMTSSATGLGSLIFEIDGVPQLQLSGSVPWQQSFFYVSAGQHTFTWLYAKNAGDPAGNDFAYLDDVQFISGTTLIMAGSSSSDQFSINASGSNILVGLNGATQSFASTDFTKYLFNGVGGTATLTGSASGNRARLYSNGSGQYWNTTAGYTVNVTGMTDINAVGHAGDMAQFFDTAGDSTYFAYADYNGSGQQLAGMYANAGGYSNTASGFGMNAATTTSGSNDTAAFFDSPGNDTFYAYADYNGAPGTPGPGQQLAGMLGSYGSYSGGYSNSARGFATNVAKASNGGSDIAVFFDSAEIDTFYAYADYNGSGKQLAGMMSAVPGGGYSNSASGFGTNVGNSTNGLNNTATFFDSPSNDMFYAYGDYDLTNRTLAGMYGSYGGGYANCASGFSTMVGISSNGGTDTATLADSPGNDTLYSNGAVASLYGNNGAYVEQATGFSVVNAYGTLGGFNTEGQGSPSYTLNYFGTWVTVPSGYTITADQAVISTAAEAASTGFTFADAATGTAYAYTVTSSGGGGSVTGSGSVTSATQDVTGINVSSLANGTLTFSVTLTNEAGNTGLAATATATLDIETLA